MSKGLREREEALERKFQHDREIEFKVKARAQKRVALWAGEQLGLTEIELETYAQRKLNEFVRERNEEMIIAEISNELERKDVKYSVHQLSKMLEYYAQEARKEMLKSN